MQYHHVDVFSSEKFGGNQLAVFSDARGLSTEQMQAIAREMNFSESSFVFPPDNPENDYKVRIFTPSKEMPMAGHPTIGTAFVLHHTRMFSGNQLRLEEKIGLIPVSIDSSADADKPLITMDQPLPQFHEIYDKSKQDIADIFGLEASAIRNEYPIQVVTCGVAFLVVPISDLDALKRAKVRLDVLERVLGGQWPEEIIIFAPRAVNPEYTVRYRMFAPDLGIIEDPATGAAAGPLGSYLVKYGLAPANTPLVFEQGYEMGRPSQLHVTIGQENVAINRVQVGGYSVYMGQGTLEL